MNRPTRALAVLDFGLAAILGSWAIAAAWYLAPLLSTSGVAAPLPNLKPDQEGGALLGGLLCLALMGIIRGIAGLIVCVQAGLGLLLVQAGRSAWQGGRNPRAWHSGWAVLALIVEAPVFWLVGLHEHHATTGGLPAIAAVCLGYAIVILALGPVIHGRDEWPGSRPLSKPKPLADEWV